MLRDVEHVLRFRIIARKEDNLQKYSHCNFFLDREYFNVRSQYQRTSWSSLKKSCA